MGTIFSNGEIDASSNFSHQSWFDPENGGSLRISTVEDLVYPGEVAKFQVILSTVGVQEGQYKVYFAPVAEDVEWFGREIGLSFTVNVLPPRENSEVDKVEVDSSLSFLWPTEGRITQYFGKTPYSYNYEGGLHTGIDIENQVGTPIYATESGEVISAKWDGGYGLAVRIDHGDGLVSIYGHLSKTDVNEGDIVEKGKKIGEIGSTGWATGNHLHFEMRKLGKPFNPLDLSFEGK